MQSHFHIYVTVFWVVLNVLFLNNYICLGIQRNLTQTTLITTSKYKLNVHSSLLGSCEKKQRKIIIYQMHPKTLCAIAEYWTEQLKI